MSSLFINGEWREGRGPEFTSADPATGAIIWSGQSALAGDIASAVMAARHAFPAWAQTPLTERIAILERYRDLIKRDLDDLATLISKENGKPFWEAKTEAGAVAGKVDLSIRAQTDRAGTRETASGPTDGVLRHKPHGVMAVLGPFNFPVHLSNGHIVPALLAGNCVVVKPSELTPSPLAFLIERFVEAGVPTGVINLVQGARETGEALVSHPGIDGILFTGGVKAGHAIHKQFAGEPGKILALELGGNNPLIWWDTDDLEAAAYAVVQSAFLTAGQRCTCARRLIMPAGDRGNAMLEMLCAMTARIRIGAAFDEPAPFMGPVVSAGAATMLKNAFANHKDAGGVPIVEMVAMDQGDAFVTPGIIDMTDAATPADEEYFGPLLQVVRVKTFDAAIEAANATRFGLAAGLLSDDEQKWDQFFALSRAGIVNWNRQTTGASGAAPFGGIGASGNHRPSAYYAADYCAYPVASMTGETLLPVPDAPVGLF